MSTNEYIKFASLLPKSVFDDDDDKLKSVEKDGQLMFVRSTDCGKIPNISVWLEAFHVFVAIYCSKFPAEIGHLMTYTQIIQGISMSSGDNVASTMMKSLDSGVKLLLVHVPGILKTQICFRTRLLRA